jgi:hypothetical protein
MRAATRFLASALLGGCAVAAAPALLLAQTGLAPAASSPRTGPLASGALAGIVQDERGVPVAGVVVSVLGTSTSVAVTDSKGRFGLSALAPGSYLVRAHLAGYTGPRSQTVLVTTAGVTSSSIALRRVGAAGSILAAGFGSTGLDGTAQPAPSSVSSSPSDLDALPAATADATAKPAADEGAEDDAHIETVWRIRHGRRPILKDVVLPVETLAGDNDFDRRFSGAGRFIPVSFLDRAVGSSARAAGGFFADTDFSGQVNLVAAGSFDAPQKLFTSDTVSRNVADLRVGAPVGAADWTVRGAVTQADLSSWIVAGTYTTRASTEPHRYDMGLSYSAQRYEGGNLLALRDVADGTRNAGIVYAYDNYTITPGVTLGYGATYARYDYLDTRGLLSPRVALTVTPIDRLRVSGVVSQRELAPGAEEFMPSAGTGAWLPPQRTFSSLSPGEPFRAERTLHEEVGVERDLGATTVAFRAFRQRVNDQLLTVFGSAVPGHPEARLGHYLVGNVGDVDANGYTVSFRTVIASRVRGSLEYMTVDGQLTANDLVPDVLLMLEPSPAMSSRARVHALTTRLEAEVPETSTRVLVLYRVGNGVTRAAGRDGGYATDARFDVQIRQSLPFMNFSSARWEALIAVRNFFRDLGPEQSAYDELLVVRPPKRVVGGVTLRF